MSDSTAERVGRYQLLEPIGVGPSGAVSRAKVFGVAGFERQFAVKRFHPELTATATMAQALSAAARAYGSLEHPRIARMSEFGVAQGQTFTAVEYVAGIDALRLVNEARTAGVTLAAGGALAIVSQAARAIGYAHGRGLSHLGLAPTNVIITGDGDVKITDFGILAATLPAQPTNVARLANRIAYLSPEQLASEATSAATDVFALGVLAYELVTSQRTFRGDTPAQIAQSIMSGPPMEPALPRPIVRVLQRCIARSPFERFPDARALADALDAALRVAPVPGTRKDIGAQVAQVLERLAALNDGEMSGMVALNLGTGPIPRSSLEGPSIEGPPVDDTSTTEFVRPDVHVPGPAPLTGPGSTVPDMPRLPFTVPGLAPPPIPVPQGIGSTQPPPITPTGSPPSTTLLGMQGAKPPPIPSVRGREVSGNVAAVPSLMRPRTGGVPILPANTIQGARPGDSGRVPAGAPSATSGLASPVVLGPRPSPITDDGDLPTARATSLDRDSDLSTREYPEAGPPLRPSDAETLAGEPTDGLLTASRKSDTLPLLPDRPSEHPTAVRPPIELPPPVPDHRHDVARTADVVRTERRDDWGRIDAGRAEPVRIGTSTPPPLPVVAPPPPVTIAPQRPLSVPPLSPPASSRAPAAVDALFDPVDQLSVPPAPAVGEPGMPLFNASSYVSERSASESDSYVLQLVAEPPTLTGLGPSRPPTQPPPTPGSSRPGSQPSRLSEILGAQPQPPGLDASSNRAPAAASNDLSLKAPTFPPIQPPVAAPSPTVAPPYSPPGYPTPMPGEGPSRPMPTVGASMVDAHKSTSKTWLWVVLGLLVVGGGGAIAAWQTGMFGSDDNGPVTGNDGSGSGSETKHVGAPADAPQVASKDDAGSSAPIDATLAATASADAAIVEDAPQVAVATDAGLTPADAATAVAASVDAGTPAPRDAGVTPAPTSGELVIASNPPGARVFLGGADQGVTPVKVPGTADRHTIALMLPGHELYVAQVDGRGSFTIPLPEITPTSGPAGIKVLKCVKDRYYVFVDGKPTGQMCPTERIGCETGPHTVEVYDVVSETRRKWEIDVKDTRLSYRVRVDN